MYYRKLTAERQPVSPEKARLLDTTHDSDTKRYHESLSFIFSSRRRDHETRSAGCTTLELYAQCRYRMMCLNSRNKPRSVLLMELQGAILRGRYWPSCCLDQGKHCPRARGNSFHLTWRSVLVIWGHITASKRRRLCTVHAAQCSPEPCSIRACPTERQARSLSICPGPSSPTISSPDDYHIHHSRQLQIDERLPDCAPTCQCTDRLNRHSFRSGARATEDTTVPSCRTRG